MENSISKIPNDLPAARKQYQELLEYERKLNKLFRMLDRFLKEGKRGDLTDEYLEDQRKRADKTRRNMLADRKALEEKFKELQQDTILQSERNKNVDFKKNPLKLIPKQSPVQKIPTAKTTSFPVVSFLKVKLVQIAPMREILRIENVSLLETQELQPFKPTVKRVLSCGIHECIQTTSRGNEGKYSLHVSSETGAPRVSLNLSLSTAKSLNLPYSFTTTRQRMMLTSTASNIQQSRALEKLIPLERGPGTLLVVKQPSATRWTLPPSSRFPAVFSMLLPEDSSNGLLISMPLHTSLVSTLSSLQQPMRQELPPIMDLPLVVRAPPQSSRFPAVLSTLLPEKVPTTAINHGIKINRVRRERLPLSIATVPPQPRPRGADEDSLAILNHSEEEISHELPDSSRSEIVEVTDVDEPLKISDVQDTTAFKSGCSETESNMSGNKKRIKKRSICRRIFALFTCCFRKQRQRK